MLSVGVVGLGYWGPNLVRNVIASGRTSLAAICDTSPERLASVGTQYPHAAPYDSASLMFEDERVDAVAVATPVSTHYEIAKEALRAGKHVIVEKPLTRNSAHAEDLIETAHRLQRVLMVNHIFLYSPAVRRLLSTVESGTVGELRFIDSVRINLGLIQSDVNVVWDLAPHDLSILDALIGREPESLVVVGSSHTANGQVDVAHIHLDYGRGIEASVHVNWLSPVKIRHFMVGGTKQSVLYNDLDRSEPIKVYDRGIDVAPPNGKRSLLVSYRSGDVVSPRVQPDEPLRVMLEHFADAIEHAVPPISDGAQGLRLVRILEAADRSLQADGARIGVG